MQEMKKFNWQGLSFADSDGDHPFVPALCCFFYFSAGVHEVAGKLAEGVEHYVKFVGLDVLQSYAARSGNWKPLTKRQFSKDLEHLRDFPKDHVGVRIEYDSGEGGEPGEFGIYVETYEDDEDYRDRASELRVDFPPQWFETQDVEAFIDFVCTMVQLDSLQSAHIGYTFKSTSGSADDAFDVVHKWLHRYLGFSPCDFDLRDEMLGHTFTAHWINYIDDDLASSLGGLDAIADALPECDVRKLSKGVLIRGAKFPPIGDINRKAHDIGRLPEVARLLKPTRIDIEKTFFANTDEDFDATRWIERLDDLDTRAWDNTDAL